MIDLNLLELGAPQHLLVLLCFDEVANPVDQFGVGEVSEAVGLHFRDELVESVRV